MSVKNKIQIIVVIFSFGLTLVLSPYTKSIAKLFLYSHLANKPERTTRIEEFVKYNSATVNDAKVLAILYQSGNYKLYEDLFRERYRKNLDTLENNIESQLETLKNLSMVPVSVRELIIQTVNSLILHGFYIFIFLYSYIKKKEQKFYLFYFSLMPATFFFILINRIFFGYYFRFFVGFISVAIAGLLFTTFKFIRVKLQRGQ